MILGGGYIGVEFAGVFAGLGAQVDLVYRQPYAAARVRRWKFARRWRRRWRPRG